MRTHAKTKAKKRSGNVGFQWKPMPGLPKEAAHLGGEANAERDAKRPRPGSKQLGEERDDASKDGKTPAPAPAPAPTSQKHVPTIERGVQPARWL